MNKLQHFKHLLNDNPYTPKKEKRTFNVFCYSLLTISIIFFWGVCIEIYFKEYRLAIWTVSIAIVTALLYIWTKKQQNMKLARIFMGILMSWAYTMTFLRGTGNGFGAAWMLLLPGLTMYLLGMKLGIMISLYFCVFEGVFCFFPAARVILKVQYSSNYLSVLFVILTIQAVFSFIIMYVYYDNQFKIKKLEEQLEKDVLTEHEKLADISLKTILVISNAVEAKDEYTSQHSHRVADFSCMIAKKLGWTETQIAQLRNIALLHDIGKISVRESVLNKPGRLTDEEFAEIKRHTVVGGEILHDLTLIPNVALGAKFHHERYDSRGYPTGLEGTDIPLEARIIGIADSFDAMRYRRVYRGECDPNYILGELEKGRGTQFDPELLDIFLKVIEEEHLL